MVSDIKREKGRKGAREVEKGLKRKILYERGKIEKQGT